MAKNIDHVQHVKSNVVIEGKPKLPQPSALVEGELAVNYAKGYETISLKNTSGEVVTFSSDNYYTEQKLGSGFTGENSAMTVTEAIENLDLGNEVEVNSGDTPSGETIELWIDESFDPAEADVYTKAETDALLTGKLDKSDFNLYSGATSILIGEKASQHDLETVSGTVTAHTANTVIHVTSAQTEAWDAKVDSADIADFFNEAEYDYSAKTINFYNGETLKVQIDATAFIKDGMVDEVKIDDVEISGETVTCLVITFNTDAGKEDINIPLTDIFDPSNYYTKSDVNDIVSGLTDTINEAISGINETIEENEQITSAALNDLEERKMDASAYTPTDLSDYYTKEETDARDLWVSGDVQNSIVSKNGGNSATGSYSVAEGRLTTANGDNSHAEGFYTETNNDSEHTSGKFNVSNTAATASGQTLFSVGNGTGTDARHNAFEIRQNGDIYITNKDGNDVRLQDEIVTDLSNYYTKDETSGKTEISNALDTKADNDAFTAHTADTTIHLTSGDVETQIDNRLGSGFTGVNSAKTVTEVIEENEQVTSAALNDLEANKLDASAYTPTDLSDYYRKEETSGKTEISNALGAKVNTATFTAHTANTEMHVTSAQTEAWDAKLDANDVDQVLDQTTSASTNPVASQAVYSTLGAFEQTIGEAFVGLKTSFDTHSGNTDIHVTRAEKDVWDAKADLADIPSVSGYADSVKYNDTTHYMEFYNGTTTGTKVYEFDASPFIIDGMVENVEIDEVAGSGTCLVVTFNTDAGKQDINIPLSDIFDPSNYYDKDAIDDIISGITDEISAITDTIEENEEITAAALTDLDERKLDASAYTPSEGGLWVSGTGENSVVLKGSSGTASGDFAVAEGVMTSGTGNASRAEGALTLSNGMMSHAEGYQTKAFGDFGSHAEGWGTIASGESSHAEGHSTGAVGDGSHSEGEETVAHGDYSHAEGNMTHAMGNTSHAEGSATFAYGDYAHTEGVNTFAYGAASHTEGYGTRTSNYYEHASGIYNISNSATTEFGHSGNTLFSVGNGADYGQEHNAFEIRQNGDIYIVSGSTDIKLQDYLGGGGGSITVDQVLDDTTSASTNPVSSKAVYDAVTDNELVWTNAFVTLSGTVSAHTIDTNIHITSADRTKLDSITGNVGTMAYQNASSYSSATEVNTALGNKANTSDLASYADSVKYNSTSHYVEFYHGTTAGTKVYEFDASDFIIDGMVDDVRIEDVAGSGTCLVIDFNTASGKQDINIPLTQIFDPSNYYNKAAIDALVGSGFTSSSITDVIIENEEIISAALNDLEAKELWVSGTGANAVVQKGSNGTASGDLAHAEGQQTSGTGIASHAEGYATLASGEMSHAEGYQTTASNFCAHAEGDSTTASGWFSHSEGQGTSATSNSSHAEGISTQANGQASHAEGEETIANGEYSHAEGWGTITNNQAEYASGSFNVSHRSLNASGQTLFSVGNGTADDARHNAFEIRQNGDIYITSGGTDILLQDNIGDIASLKARVGIVSAVTVSSNLTNITCPDSITGASNNGAQATVIYENGGSTTDYTISVTTTYKSPDGNQIQLTCPKNGYCEVSYLNINGTIYARGI